VGWPKLIALALLVHLVSPNHHHLHHHLHHKLVDYMVALLFSLFNLQQLIHQKKPFPPHFKNQSFYQL
jgi:hypothetical protein